MLCNVDSLSEKRSRSWATRKKEVALDFDERMMCHRTLTYRSKGSHRRTRHSNDAKNPNIRNYTS